MSQTETAPAQPDAPKKKSKLLKLVVPIVVLLAGGGAGGWWYFKGRTASTVQAAEPAPEPPAMVKFEPFIVNLADPGGRRFLRVSLNLLVSGEKAAEELEKNKLLHLRVRSSILELLTTQTSAGVATSEGRTALKKAIAETATHALEHTEVSDVLFAEFVVQ